MAFEYKHETFTEQPADGIMRSDAPAPSTFEQWLNALGAEGWELVGVQHASATEHVCTFKRTLKPARAEATQLTGLPLPKPATPPRRLT